MSVTLFSLFMAIARLSIDPVVDRYSPRAVASTLLVVAAIGLLMVAMAPHPFVALAGFSLMGVGCSAVYPLAVCGGAAHRRWDTSIGLAYPNCFRRAGAISDS